MARIRNGWIEGDLPGPKGPVEVHRDASPPYPGLAGVKPNLVLHTTETSRLASWEFPPQFTVGEGVVVQHRPTWAKGEALRGDTTNDPYAMQVEIVGYSKLDVWLPPPPSLFPLVALVAFLHKEGVIRTGLERPANWPTKLDRGPQAVEGYYRRQAGLWPTKAGVYGHVDIPGNTHWDPGSFDHSAFFAMVRAVLNPDQEDDAMFKEWIEGTNAYRNEEPLREDWPADKKHGWRFARWASSNPKPGVPGPHEHTVTGSAS